MDYFVMTEIRDYLKKLRLLIVDDDRISGMVLKNYLDGVFDFVHIAENGKLGLLAFLQNKFDMIVTDIYMPEMNGIEMIKKIRKIDFEVPIVVITSSDDVSDMKELLNLGIGRFIQKPITKSYLVSALLDAASRVILKQKILKEKEMEIEILKYREKYNVYQQIVAYRKEISLLKNEVDKKKIELDGVKFVFNSFYKPMEILCGDAYIYRLLFNDKLLGVIFDTMGKGLSAAVTSVLSVAFMNHAVDKGIENRDFDFKNTLISFLNYVKKVLLDEEMLSASFFLIDLTNAKCEYAHCGMPSIILKKKGGFICDIPSNNPPICKYTNDINTLCIDLKDIDSLLIASDGLAESYTKNNDIYMNYIDDDFKCATFYNNFENLFLDKIPSFSDDVSIFYLKRLTLKKIWEIRKELNTNIEEIQSFLKEIDEFLTIKHLKDDIISKINVSLYEFIMNAYEHGNLGIDVDKKHRLIADDMLEKYCKEMEKTCSKKIFVKYGVYVTDDKEIFVANITDEGEGFNTNMTNRALENTEYFCGRGIVLSNTFVDGLYYNLKGNEVEFYVGL